MPPCKACYVCFKTERCVQRDDMQDVLEKVAACDVMVLASPTYFLTMSGQMKIFIDRLLPKWQNLDGKDAYVIVTGHDGKRGLKRTAEDMVAILENLGDRVKQIIWGEHVWQKGKCWEALFPSAPAVAAALAAVWISCLTVRRVQTFWKVCMCPEAVWMGHRKK